MDTGAPPADGPSLTSSELIQHDPLAQEMRAAIRGWLAAHYPPFVPKQTRIQYGGSVKPGNAAELLNQPDIDGALVGGASLAVDSFVAIVRAGT